GRRAAERSGDGVAAADAQCHAREPLAFGRRRRGLDRGRLSAFLPDAAQWRRARRCAAVGAENDRAYGLRPSAARLRLWRDGAAAVRRVGAGAGDGLRLRPRLCGAQGTRALAGAGFGRRIFLGRRHRHLFLDRPAGADGGRPDAAGAGPAAALPLSEPPARLCRADQLPRPPLPLISWAAPGITAVGRRRADIFGYNAARERSPGFVRIPQTADAR